jgi:hypothetical protein
MDIPLLKRCLTEAGKEELGIPVILPSMAESIFPIAQWALEGTPTEGRQVWFCVGNAKDLQKQLDPQLRNRIIPLSPYHIPMAFERGPFDALLLPHHGFSYSDPNMTVSPFWKQRGSYQLCPDFQHSDVCLWFWKSNRKPLKLFGIDHHHAVQWDIKQILRPLGVKLDFVWLCDGRPPINEAIPSAIPGFYSSHDIYRPAPETPLSSETKAYIEQKGYDGVLTSHSLVTCFRLKELNLPMLHINSTRFGNDWIQDPTKHQCLVSAIQELLTKNRIHVIHNNEGDSKYFSQYFPSLSPHQEICIPSLCESLMRLRNRSPTPSKILIWDTRQVLFQETGSPFMKEMYAKLKHAHGDAIESQAVLMAQSNSYLPEGYLDSYSAVIHLPYNISTMSMFQQVRANIPIWVPSKRLLAKLLADTREPNEMSWTVFAPGSESTASLLDHVRNPEVIERWLQYADFYNSDVLPLVFQFDSIEELVENVLNTNYDVAIEKIESNQATKRENIMYAWEQVLNRLNETA